MLAIEFRLQVSSMYTIRIPYSYQCARTYPLPAPSTIKGLCANALWRKEGGNPVNCLKNIQDETMGATARAEYPILVSSCTVAMVPKNALLRQFAFTPYIDCLIAFKDDAGEKLGIRVAEALKVSPVYLGDSESLASVMPESINVTTNFFERINKGEQVKVNSLIKFAIINNSLVHTKPLGKGVVLYMQEDPISTDAALERYLAPLKQEGDNYYPLDSFAFETATECFLIRGRQLTGIFPKN
jgi:CRISPR-associated Cas5-like protein